MTAVVDVDSDDDWCGVGPVSLNQSNGSGVVRLWTSSRGGVGEFELMSKDLLAKVAACTETDIVVEHQPDKIRVTGCYLSSVDDALRKLSNLDKSLVSAALSLHSMSMQMLMFWFDSY
jgi:hypothetical protein